MKTIATIFLFSILTNVGSFGDRSGMHYSQNIHIKDEDGMKNQTGTAKGAMKIDDKAIALKHAYAMSQPNPFEKEKNEIAILLTATPLQEGALNGKTSLEEVAVRLSDYVLIVIDDERNAIAETVNHPSLEKSRLTVSGMMPDVAPPKKDFKFSEGLARVSVGGEYGYIDKTGSIVIPLQFDMASDFSEGLARVRVGGEYGYIDKTGSIVIPLQFDDAWDFSEGLAQVSVDEVSVDGKAGYNYGYIDKTGTIVIPLRPFRWLRPFRRR